MPDKQIAADNLKQAKGILDKLEVPFFLFLGTVLGAYRDKDFCVGDIDDIDIAVNMEDIMYVLNRKQHIIDAFIKEGFELEHQWEFELSFIKKYDGWRSKVDIFLLTESPGKEWRQWRFYAVPVQVRYVSSKFFKQFDEVEFYGTMYKVPGPVEEYLEANYGKNWKTPIPRDKWNWETDNKCNYITS